MLSCIVRVPFSFNLDINKKNLCAQQKFMHFSVTLVRLDYNMHFYEPSIKFDLKMKNFNVLILFKVEKTKKE